MLINLRNALMAGKRLPYDAEVEFLASTGTQWIDTLFFPTATTSVEIYCKILSTPNNYNAFFGCGTAYNGANVFCLAAAQLNSKIFCYRGSKYNQVTANNAFSDGDEIFGKISPTQGGIHNYTKGQDFYVDLSRSTYTQGQNSLYLFSGNVPGTADLRRGSNIQMYNARIFNGTTITHDYIPVRKGTVGYLYDRVSGKLFGNAGTGEFVLGQDVVPVEYLESYGSQYIATDFIPNDSSGIYLKSAPKVKSDVVHVGCRSTANGRWWVNYGSEDINSSWNTYASTDIAYASGRVYVVENNYLNSRSFVVNGETKNTALYSTTLATTTNPAAIFAANSSGSISLKAKCKIYELRFSQGSAIARDFCPIRVGTGSTWEGAMMDVLTRRIYRNAGTGAFTYGNDLKYPIPAA